MPAYKIREVRETVIEIDEGPPRERRWRGLGPVAIFLASVWSSLSRWMSN
jgi:hypothetical protein